MTKLWLSLFPLRVDTHTTSTLKGAGEEGGRAVRQKIDVVRRREWGVSKCSARPIFVFLLKRIVFATFARNLPFDPDVRHSEIIL